MVHPARDLPIACGSFSLERQSRLDRLLPKYYRATPLRLLLDDLMDLHLLKHTIQNTSFSQAIHGSIDGLPIAKMIRQSAPLAALLGDLQIRIKLFAVTY